MDEPRIASFEGAVVDGFEGERMLLVPQPAVERALAQDVTSKLLVTYAGHFPHAVRHGLTRPHGSAENILMVCTGGSGWYRTEGTRSTVARGDAVILPAGRAHTYEASPDDPWTLWWAHFTGSDAPHLLKAAHEASGSWTTHLRDPVPVASLLSQVIDALAGGTTTASLVRASGFAWNALAQIIATGRRTPGPEANPVERAVEHLRATTPRRTSVTSLASLVGLSPSQLTALFQRRLGVSPLRFQTDLRMATARQLLDTSPMSIAAIARVVGYTDPLYFSRQFSRVHGLTPTAYRGRPH